MSLQAMLDNQALEQLPAVLKHIERAEAHDKRNIASVAMRHVLMCYNPPLERMDKDQKAHLQEDIIAACKFKGYIRK